MFETVTPLPSFCFATARSLFHKLVRTFLFNLIESLRITKLIKKWYEGVPNSLGSLNSGVSGRNFITPSIWIWAYKARWKISHIIYFRLCFSDFNMAFQIVRTLAKIKTRKTLLIEFCVFAAVWISFTQIRICL